MLKNKYPNAKFLFITPEKESYLKAQAKKYNIKASDIRVVFAERNEVPFYLSASDVNLFFIKPCFSKKASSPVKLGEVLAMGLPVIANSKVGDVAEIIKFVRGGLVVEELEAESYAKVIHQMDTLFVKSPLKIRKKAQRYYDLEKAIYAYLVLYAKVLNKKEPVKAVTQPNLDMIQQEAEEQQDTSPSTTMVSVESEGTPEVIITETTTEDKLPDVIENMAIEEKKAEVELKNV